MNYLDLLKWALANASEVKPLIEDVQAFLAVPLTPAVAKVEASFAVQRRLAAIYDSLPLEKQQALVAGFVEAMDALALTAAEGEFESQGLGDVLAKLKELWPVIKPFLPILIGIITKA